jgi:hypothetical protein
MTSASDENADLSIFFSVQGTGGSSTGSDQWHTMVHIPLVFLSESRAFSSAPCIAGKKNLDDNSLLDVVEIARVA